MRTILVALRDPTLTDQIRTAMRMFPGVHAITVERDQIQSLVQEPDVADALIVDHERGRAGHDPFIAQIRQVNREIKIVAVADRPERNHFNKTKMELDVFSFIALPLDPYDLLRRLHRLMETLQVA
ncbi:MAG: hypothetical protein CL908_20030 [Deltaproteobacteria bacterium]|nr:hypothetical protein [Deltaproteobacteria bacterium]